jgi:hypothetical protein
MQRAVFLIGAIMLGATACDDSTGLIDRPENLWYQLEPSGDPLRPQGVTLRWDPVVDAKLEVYNVYGRLDGSNQFDLRGSTTSPSFHDDGEPDLEYQVSAVNIDGEESAFSEPVLIDERLRLEAPASIWSVSLDGAILVAWADNAFLNEPKFFKNYRVYGTDYDLDTPECGGVWTLEGTTVAPEFIASDLPNGVPKCFHVSAESVEGWESLWSDSIPDTPRPEARNVLMTPLQVNSLLSGFRFFQDLNTDGLVDDNELGLVRGDRTDNDFRISLVGSTVFIEPVRTGARVALYGTTPIDDLTSIDVAPVSGYSTVPISAEPGWGYVFEMDEGDAFLRFGALRVTHVGQQFIIFDWSYQTDPGNPELSVRGGLPTADVNGLVVKGHK